MKSVSWRGLFLLTFLIAMPVLALPPVARTIDKLLYGAPPTDFGQPLAPPAKQPAETPLAATAQAATAQAATVQAATVQAATVQAATVQAPPSGAERLLSQATYQETSPRQQDIQPAAYAANERPPLLAPTPPFEQLAPSPRDQGLVETPVNERTIAQLQTIRDRLEDLGADYVIVEVLPGGRYRFHCRMLVDEQSRFTKPFEASAFDPVAAGQEVLRAVEAWRAVGTVTR